MIAYLKVRVHSTYQLKRMLWPFKRTIPIGSFELSKHILKLKVKKIITFLSGPMSVTLDGHVGTRNCWIYMPLC